MKISPPIFLLLVASVSLAWTTPAHAQNKAVTNSVPGRSVFIQPANFKEGRDPFFPESSRSVEVVPVVTQTMEINSLKVLGVSGGPGHLLAIIGNHTFAIGEEGDIKTATGPMHIKCRDIQTNGVIIEINGQIHRIAVETE